MMLSLQAQSPRDRAASAPSAPAPLRPPGALEGVAGALPRSALVGRQGAAALLVAAWAGARGSRPRRGGSGRLGPGGVGAVSDSVWEAFVGEARKELEKEDYRRESKKATPLTEKQLQVERERDERRALRERKAQQRELVLKELQESKMLNPGQAEKSVQRTSLARAKATKQDKKIISEKFRNWQKQDKQWLMRRASRTGDPELLAKAKLYDKRMRVTQDEIQDALNRVALKEHEEARSTHARSMSEKVAALKGIALPTAEEAQAMSITQLRNALWNAGLPAVGLPSAPEAARLGDDQLRQRLRQAKASMLRRLLQALGDC